MGDSDHYCYCWSNQSLIVVPLRKEIDFASQRIMFLIETITQPLKSIRLSLGRIIIFSFSLKFWTYALSQLSTVKRNKTEMSFSLKCCAIIDKSYRLVTAWQLLESCHKTAWWLSDISNEWKVDFIINGYDNNFKKAYEDVPSFLQPKKYHKYHTYIF